MIKTMKNGGAKFKFDKLKITAAILIVAFLSCVVVSVISGIKLSGISRDYLSDGDNYASQTQYSKNEILYATKEKLILTSGGTRTEKTIDAIKAINEKFSLDAARIQTVYKEKDDERFYVSAKSDNGKNYTIAFDNDFEPLAFVEFQGESRAMKRVGDYLFTITENSGCFYVARYRADDLSNPVKGNLFTGSDDGDVTTLKMMKGEKILSVDEVNGKLAAVTTSGISLIDKELSFCSFMTEYEDKSNELRQSDPESSESEIQARAKEYVVGLHDGIKAFEPRSGTIEIENSDFDFDRYLYTLAEVGSYVGGAYVAEKDSFYLVGSTGEVVKTSADELSRTYFGEIPQSEIIDDLTLKDLPYFDNKALYYNAYDGSAFVIYANLSDITKLDLVNEKIVYSLAADYKIDSVISCGGNISYLYQNSNYSASGTVIKATFNEDGRIRSGLYKTLLAVFIVLSVILLVAAIIVTACAFDSGVAEKTKNVLISMRRAKFVYLAILPSFILLCAFCFYPAIASIGLSFFDYTQSKPTLLWNNFKHYINIFTGSEASLAFTNMGIFLVFDLLTALVPPLLFAFFLTVMANKKYSAITRTLLFIPGIIPSVTGLLIWQTGIYGYNGVLNKIITACGGGIVKFLEMPNTSVWSIIMMGFPFVGSYLIFYGAMMNIPSSYYEAAELEGCGVFRRFFSIDLPLIMSQIKYVIVCTFIASLQNFARTYMVNKNATNGTITPIHEMYRQMLGEDYGYAAAYATVIFVFLLFATIINMRMQFKNSEDD